MGLPPVSATPPSADAYSPIDDLETLNHIVALARLADPTGNWVGNGIPTTRWPEFKGMAHWAAVQGWYYLALTAADGAENKQDLLALDLGCAGGAHTAQLSAIYGKVLGIDQTGQLIAFARMHNAAPNIEYDCWSWPPKNVQPCYDRIFSIEVFEHFKPDVRDKAILAAIKALNPDGLLLFSMPNEPPASHTHVGCMQDSALDFWLEQICDKSGAQLLLRSWFHNEAPGEPCALEWNPWSDVSASHHAVILGKPS